MARLARVVVPLLLRHAEERPKPLRLLRAGLDPPADRGVGDALADQACRRGNLEPGGDLLRRPTGSDLAFDMIHQGRVA